MPRYTRILLKISGEAFCPAGNYGIGMDSVKTIAEEIANTRGLGVQVAVVVGGGNITRGSSLSAQGLKRTTADQMGMLATVLNGLALQEALEEQNVPTRVMTAIHIHALAEPFTRRRAVRHLEKGRVVILTAGTGNPYFTTDTAAALRAKELSADILFKATKVDGVYDADPHLHAEASRFERLSYMDVLTRQLSVMDATAVTLCMEQRIPILVFCMSQRGNVERAVRGEPMGTLISQ